MSNKKFDHLIDLNDELENYFRNTIIPQLFVDADFILRKFTPPAMKQFKLTNDDIGRSIKDMVENIRFRTIIDNIQQVIDTNTVLEKEIQTTDLSWYQMNILPYIVQKTNQTNGVIITFVDITARIKDLKDQEQLIAEHEILLDTLSHDIKNPLTSVLLALQLLKTVSFNNVEEQRSLLETVERSSFKVKDIITELTDTRRREYKYKDEQELINFEHILEDMRLSLTDQINYSGAIIHTNIHVSEIRFSRRKLRSILYNLTGNAIKYRSPDRKPEVFITTIKEEGFIVITVQDNGLGIEPEKLAHVCTKYYRVNGTNVEGTGVGLFLVKEIAENSGGKISITSELGQGSEFKVYLKV